MRCARPGRGRRGDAGRGARGVRRGDAGGGGDRAAGRGRQPARRPAIRRRRRRSSARWRATARCRSSTASLAALQRVMLLGAAMDASERQATLDGLAAARRAVPAAGAGAAGADASRGRRHGRPRSPISRRCSPSPASTEALQARARQLIVAAGGALPARPGGRRAGRRLTRRPVPADGVTARAVARAAAGRLLLAALALAGCAAADPILPGERIPVRPDETPEAQRRAGAAAGAAAGGGERRLDPSQRRVRRAAGRIRRCGRCRS